MPVFSAIKRTRLAQKRPRNHTPDFMFAVEYATRNLAQLVKPFERNHLFVRGDLKDRIGRRVKDRLARRDVLFTKHLDDLRARSGNVAEYARHISLAREPIENRRREPVR